MMNLFGEQTSAANLFSAYASLAASLMLLRTMFNDVIPEPVKSYLSSAFGGFFKYFIEKFCNNIKSKMTIVVDEENGITRNQVYDAAEIYLRTIINPDAQRLKANKGVKQKSISLSMEKNEVVTDCFQGIDLKWQFVLVEPEEGKRYQPEKRYFELTFDKSEKERVVNEYLPFVLARSKEIKASDRAVKLYTRDCPFDSDDDDGGNRGSGYWGCIDLDHPVTFEKLAMDLKLKQAIKDDLDRFLRRKEYYRKVGKAWKRGYLLYGPPGTGKSSLIAAIANYLKFDVYDLELSTVYDNKELRKLLLCINNKSIIVIEDIDCSTQMQDRGLNGDAEPDFDSDTKLTLSGVLNFIDGLWSTCGDERIIIFTTNHKEKLDPALLRPGRMDMHIHMGYCTPDGFDVLAFNYLGLSDHPKKFPEIKELIGKVEVSPAEIAEHLMRNEDADLALEGLIDLLKEKNTDKNETEDKIEDDKKDKGMRDEGKGKDEKQRMLLKNLLKFRRRVNRKLNKPMNK